MVAVVLIHMCQVFLFGAYKFPRELTWILGVFLLLMTLGHGIHRAGDALRPGCVLGAGHWRLDRIPHTFHRRTAGRPDVRGADHRGSHVDPLLCPACLCDSGNDVGVRRAAHLDGGGTGYQRLAHAGANRPSQHLYSGVPRADAQGRHSFRPRGGVERHDIFRRDPVCGGAVRCVFGALWADWLS